MPPIADVVADAVQEGLSSRERWRRWEVQRGWASAHGLKGRGSSRGAHPPTQPVTAEQHRTLDKAGVNDWPKRSETTRAVLGHHEDTRSLHAAPGHEPGTYTAERKVLHDKIVAHFLKGRSKAEGQPEALFMAGGGASGKSRALKDNPALQPKDAVEINPDEIKAMLPEYQHLLEHKDSYAAAAAHEESADIAKRLLAEAHAGGHNVLVDGTGNSQRGKFAGKLKAMHDKGYKVRALYVTVPTHVAVERAVARAERTGRHVPIPTLREHHRNVSAWFHDVAGLPFLHGVEVHDTSSGSSVKVASAAHGKLTVHDQAGFKRFIEKGNET